jgi:hypothetical protein
MTKFIIPRREYQEGDKKSLKTGVVGSMDDATLRRSGK